MSTENTISEDMAASASMAPGPGVGRKRVERLRDFGIVFFLVALIVALSLSSSAFLSIANISNLLDSVSAMGLIACGGMVVIIAGGFDLSAGAIYAVAAVIGAKLVSSTGVPVAIVVAVLAGCGVGLINGLLCTVGRINPFVATLGTMIAVGGLSTVIAGSASIFVTNMSFGDIAQPQFLDLHVSTWILIVAAGLCSLVLNRSVVGAHLFALGGNARAARASGLPIYKTLTLSFILSGGLAAIAGLVDASRSLSVTPSDASGEAILFNALAAILIGGNSVMGGEGAIWRTLTGVLILGLIQNGFDLLGFNPLYQQIISGVLILLAVGVDVWTRRRPA